MAVTIKQIAAAAGVSRGTVDRVLHNRPGVSPEVAAHVRKIAEELGFSPNRAGKILAARKQPITIGCFLASLGNPFFADVIAGYRQAEQELKDFGVSLRIREVSGYNPQEHLEGIRQLVSDGCDALCLSTVDTPEIRGCINELTGDGIPVVAVNNDLTGTDRLCYVGCDFLEAGRTAAGLLSMMASEKLHLLIVTGSLNIPGHNDRIRGFSRVLREKGVDYSLIDIFESQDNDDHAYRTTLRMLRSHPEINCIYIAAAGVQGTCLAAMELGRHRELYILSHDVVESTRKLVRDGVINFTIAQEPFRQGYEAIRLLFDYLIDGKKTPPGNYIVSPVIKIRENLDG